MPKILAWGLILSGKVKTPQEIVVGNKIEKQLSRKQIDKSLKAQSRGEIVSSNSNFWEEWKSQGNVISKTIYSDSPLWTIDTPPTNRRTSTFYSVSKFRKRGKSEINSTPSRKNRPVRQRVYFQSRKKCAGRRSQESSQTGRFGEDVSTGRNSLNRGGGSHQGDQWLGSQPECQVGRSGGRGAGVQEDSGESEIGKREFDSEIYEVQGNRFGVQGKEG